MPKSSGLNRESFGDGKPRDGKPRYAKPTVNFRKGTLNKHCGACEHFVEPDKCTEVLGRIGRGDVCDLFERRG